MSFESKTVYSDVHIDKWTSYIAVHENEVAMT